MPIQDTIPWASFLRSVYIYTCMCVCVCLKREREKIGHSWLPWELANVGRNVYSLFFILDASSQDCYDIPRTFPSDRSSSLEGFHNHFVSITDLGMIECIFHCQKNLDAYFPETKWDYEIEAPSDPYEIGVTCNYVFLFDSSFCLLRENVCVF